MRENLLLALICLLAGVTLLSSCDKKDDSKPPKSKEEIWYWGYFKGTINGIEVSLENGEYPNRPIYSIRQIANYEEGKYYDYINIIYTGITYDGYSILNITLYDLAPVIRYITLPVSAYWYESSMRIVSGKTKTYYEPKEDDPIRVEIIDVVWLSPMDPILEVKINGVLYNRDNLNDTIVIDGIYGTR